MELQQLRYFLAVADRQSIAAAAQELRVSPSALSRAVSLLEKELEVQLFTREGRAIRVNRFGLEFASSVDAALNALTRAIDGVRQSASRETGTVSLGFLTSLGVDVVPSLIRAHRGVTSSVAYQLRQNSGAGVINDLVEGRTDLCLSVEGIFADDRIDWCPLLTQRLVIVVALTHRLARRATVSLTELGDEEFVALSSEFTLRRLFDRACERYGVTPNIVFEGSDVGTLRGLIAGEIGIGLLPESMGGADENVRQISVVEEGMTRPISMGWVKNRYLPPAAVAFRDRVTTAMSSKSGEM